MDPRVRKMTALEGRANAFAFAFAFAYPAALPIRYPPSPIAFKPIGTRPRCMS
jgi:hypothetical protein